jgi:hypothetical protein
MGHANCVPIYGFLSNRRAIKPPAKGRVARVGKCAVGGSVHGRVRELLEHHDARLDATRRVLLGSPGATGHEVAGSLPWTRRERTFAELDDVAANISMVMAGLDPETGDYTDPIESIRKEMDEIAKDNSIPDKDKKQMIAEMEEALKSTPPLQFKENITLVKKYHKEIDKAMQDPEVSKK